MKKIILLALFALMLPGCPAFLLMAAPSILFTGVTEIDCQANHKDTHTCRGEMIGGEKEESE